MTARTRVASLAALALLVAGGAAAYARAGRARELSGDCATISGTQVCTWARMKGGEVTDVALIVPDALADRAPADVPMTWPPRAEADVQFPAEVRQSTGIQHATIYWEAHGHPPGPYLVPHFDFHFYVQSSAETAAIDCKDLSKPAALPTGYELPDVPVPGLGTLVGLCVPGMGMHAAPVSELRSTQPFQGTMIIGYDRGRLIFVEPMLSKGLLQAHRSFPLEMPALPAPANVRLPTRFQGEYDAAAHAYRFVFSGFSKA